MNSLAALVILLLLPTDRVLSDPVRRQLRALPNFSKHISHAGQDLVFGHSVGQRVTFFYALCDRHDNSSQKLCALVLEPLDREGQTRTKSRTKSRTCVFELVSKKRNGRIARKFSLTQFGRNELIFVWKEGEKTRRPTDRHEANNEYSVKCWPRSRRSDEAAGDYVQELLRLRVVHMKSCRFHETNVTVDEKAHRVGDHEITGLNVVAFGNGAEIFFRNEELCGRERRCRIEYNSKTHKFSSYSVEGLPVKYDATAKIQSTWSQGSRSADDRLYLVDSMLHEAGSVQILEANGDELEAHYYSWSVFDIDLRASAVAYSALRSQMAICMQAMSSTSLDCVSSEDDFQVALSLRSRDVRLLRVRNLPGGGFLLLIGYGPEGVTDRLEQLDHVKLDSQSQIVASYGLKDFQCQSEGSRLDGDFFEKRGSEYCYYINCVSPRPAVNQTELDLDEYHWHFHAYCMPEEKQEEDHVGEHT
ncbi:uncharacterized protein LOC107980555 isoform X2 [Nasonia vitripennis]|uniref:Uncharacterized protein n=1 Tax=Nasonia vitripennis TaxID=7425 RepID=A0A7M7IYS7_NASVI|nr:uncharacterized protein LOC107980555 isoform X2 [Nasonia vitripennis]